jgi:hypothetical protein
MSIFKDSVLDSLKDQPPGPEWHYIAWKEKASGKFVAAAICDGDFMGAIRKGQKICMIDNEKCEVSARRRVYEDKGQLPRESLRNCKLGEEEVRLWMKDVR